MEQNINIYQILMAMDYPFCEEFYSPFFGKVSITCLPTKDAKHDKTGIQIKTESNGDFLLNMFGKLCDHGEVVIFPSKEMRDWRKFQWKKGDLLHQSGRLFVYFVKWANDQYTEFEGLFQITRDNEEKKAFNCDRTYKTAHFSKCIQADVEVAKNIIEKQLGGRLNLETLELEHEEKPVYEVGKLYYFEMQEGDETQKIIGKLEAKGEEEDSLTFGYQLVMNVERFDADQAFDLRISVHPELRPATEKECVHFAGAYQRWTASQHEFNPKTFDKVLVRTSEKARWIPAIFIRDRGENEYYRYNAFVLHSASTGDFKHCIRYEGNEHVAFTAYDADTLPF